MGKELKILIIEDDLADAIRLTHELKKRGIVFHGTRVETREDFLSSIQSQQPDIILSDHGLPSFTGFEALEIIQESCPQVPFVFVTGSYDHNMIVEMFDGGAAGYVFKNRLSELVPVIQQALDEVKQRARRREEETSSQNEPADQPPLLQEIKPAKNIQLFCARCKNVRSEDDDWEPLESYLRKHRQATVTLALCPSCA